MAIKVTISAGDLAAVAHHVSGEVEYPDFLPLVKIGKFGTRLLLLTFREA